ncbi:ChaN family lipoprotein [Stutzerimonas stutzeri]|uniref:ChaN family lipoprotein n=1 Tax=Stutzerimonas stutzeri TaxID=316 RepID=UPI001BD032E9|nr:ChaN family lipoprotein [Stutzerimonas stutzeri]
MRIFFLPLLLLLSACQTLPPLPEWQSPEGRDHADLGAIVDLHSGERLSAAQLVRRLATADYVLVGERHDNPDHHALQLWLLQALADQRSQGSLLLEMLTPEQQPAVARAQTQLRRGEPVEDLPASLAWSPGWPWQLYGPLVSHALAQPFPLMPANLTRAEIGQIYREVPRLPDGESTRAEVADALRAQIVESHCGMLPDSQVPAMLAVQQQRDRRMAARLLAAPKPTLLIAGGFHARRDLGAPLHLLDLGAAGNAQVLMLAEVGERVAAQQADFVWYTPAQPAKDYCEEMRRR